MVSSQILLRSVRVHIPKQWFFSVSVNSQWIVACEQQTYIRSSFLSLRKTERLRTRAATFCFDVGKSDQRKEYSSSDSSRPRALVCLGFWRELPNTLWNVNFTIITRFPATLNADFFMKQLLLKLCMWCGPLVSLSCRAVLEIFRKAQKATSRVKLHLDRRSTNRLVFRIGREKIHQYFLAWKYDVKQPSDAT